MAYYYTFIAGHIATHAINTHFAACITDDAIRHLMLLY